MIRKGIDREERGKLVSFYDLTEKDQLIFLKIKEQIKLSISDKEDVFVYGSFLWGNWCDTSDYDVYIKHRSVANIVDFYDRIETIKKTLKALLNVKVDIVMSSDNFGILIP